MAITGAAIAAMAVHQSRPDQRYAYCMWKTKCDSPHSQDLTNKTPRNILGTEDKYQRHWLEETEKINQDVREAGFAMVKGAAVRSRSGEPTLENIITGASTGLVKQSVKEGLGVDGDDIFKNFLI